MTTHNYNSMLTDNTLQFTFNSNPITDLSCVPWMQNPRKGNSGLFWSVILTIPEVSLLCSAHWHGLGLEPLLPLGQVWSLLSRRGYLALPEHQSVQPTFYLQNRSNYIHTLADAVTLSHPTCQYQGGTIPVSLTLTLTIALILLLNQN